MLSRQSTDPWHKLIVRMKTESVIKTAHELLQKSKWRIQLYHILVVHTEGEASTEGRPLERLSWQVTSPVPSWLLDL